MKITDKNKTMYFTAMFVVALTYNIVVFVLPFDKGGGFWTGYIFSMLSIILSTTIGYYAINREGLKSKFYRIPLVSVALCYLTAQIIIGLLEMALSSIPYRYGIALNVIMLAACLLGLISTEAAVNEIERIDEKVKGKVFYIKSLQADIETLIDKTQDDSVRKTLTELAETIRYSDPMSSPQLSDIEKKIETKADTLADIVEAAITDAVESLCSELQQLFAERNRKCKILK